MNLLQSCYVHVFCYLNDTSPLIAHSPLTVKSRAHPQVMWCSGPQWVPVVLPPNMGVFPFRTGKTISTSVASQHLSLSRLMKSMLKKV